MVSVYVGAEKLDNGAVVHEFRHYVFGGLAETKKTGLPRMQPTNDIIEVRTRQLDLTNYHETSTKNELNFYLQDQNRAALTPITHSGIKPVPRCDHYAQLIT